MRLIHKFIPKKNGPNKSMPENFKCLRYVQWYIMLQFESHQREFKATRYSAYHKTKKSHWDARNRDHTEN